MQVLIHKTSLERLEFSLRKLRICLGDPIELVRDEKDELAAIAKLPTSMPFGLGWGRHKRLGYLGAQAKATLLPAIEINSPLRVRIVEIESAHLCAARADRISVSVWGDPANFMTVDTGLAVQL